LEVERPPPTPPPLPPSEYMGVTAKCELNSESDVYDEISKVVVVAVLLLLLLLF
jgi:hypothetical protein